MFSFYQFNIKDSWDEVTIAEFVQIKDILLSPNFDEFTKEIMIIALLAGQDDFRVFDNFPKTDAERLFSSITFLNDQPKGDICDLYTINGIEYRFCKNISQLKTGQFYDLTKYLEVKEDFFQNLAKICSVFLIPTRRLSYLKRLNNRFLNAMLKTERGQKIAKKRGLKVFLPNTENYLESPIAETQANLFFNMKITDAMGLAVFMSACSMISIEAILQYSEQQAKQWLKSAVNNLKQSNDPKSQVYTEQLDLLLPGITDGLPSSISLQDM